MTSHEPESEQNKNKIAATRTSKLRICLSCQGKFPSEGAHNRICDNCKSLQGWATGNPGFHWHRPGAANDN